MPCRIFRIGVFFDGTGNTKKPDSSKGKMSNIAKLSDMYKEGEFKDSKGKKTISKMLYTNGVGTYDSDIVDAFHFIERKYNKGGGGGGAKRINEMIDKVTALLDEHPFHKSDDTKFTKRKIDVFGFSRGAAMARDFVNTFFKTVDGKIEYKDVRFNFIGLYDTVGSFGKPGNATDFKPKKEYMEQFDEDYLPNGIQLTDEEFGIRDPEGNIRILIGQATNQNAVAKVTFLKAEGWKDVMLIPKGFTFFDIYGKKPFTEFFEPYNFDLVQGSNASAAHIYHLTAHDEVRKNFPLTDTKGAGESNSLMGVHSDVGGGYDPNMIEEFVYPTVYMDEISAFNAAQTLANEKNETSFRKGWRAAVETTDGVCYSPKLLKETNNELSIIGLHLMYEEALSHNVPFNPPKDKVPLYLQGYYNHALTTKGTAYTYGEKGYGTKIKESFMHHSARDPAHIHDNKIATVGSWDGLVHDVPGSGNDAHYVDSEGNVVDGRKNPLKAHHVERAVFSNDSNNAVKPT